MPEIIAKDGASVRRTPVPQGFVMYPGERIDFILTANATGGSSSRNDSSSSGGSNFWIQVSTLAGDNSPVVLSYEGAPDPASDSNLGAPQLSLGCQLGMPGVIDTKLSADLLRPHGMTDPPPKFVAGKTKKKQVSALLCVGCIVPDHKGAAAALTQSCRLVLRGAGDTRIAGVLRPHGSIAAPPNFLLLLLLHCGIVRCKQGLSSAAPLCRCHCRVASAILACALQFAVWLTFNPMGLPAQLANGSRPFGLSAELKPLLHPASTTCPLPLL